MTTKVVGLAAAIIAAAVPVASAWAQVEHAQRTALEVAVRRAQVRAAYCQALRERPALSGTERVTPRLPTSPPVGTAGPVPLGDCSQQWWPFGR
ncbi:MAG: hypothetical protein NVV74_21995 [Magnetospirillum sp.]|nr:hypothetical protein [Magnetospirillum sp.]